MAESSSPSIFSKTSERINLLLPLVFLMLAVIEIIFRIQPSETEKKTVLFFAYFVFLNHLHIYLTPLMFMAYPEFSEWAKQAKYKSVNIFWLICSSFLLLFGFLALIQKTAPEFYKPIFLGIFITRGFFGFYHNLFQTYGFSCLYSKLSDTEAKTDYQNNINKYKKYFYALWIVGGLNILFAFFDVYQYSESIYGKILTAISLGLVTFLVASFSKDGARKSHVKVIYALRLYLFALAPHSLMAFAGYLAAHGVEYMLLFLHMRSRSLRKTNRLILGQLTILFLGICGIPFIHQADPSIFAIPIFLQILFAALLNSGDLAHYALDSFMFKFSRPESRKNILPLILGKSFFPDKPIQDEMKNG